MEKMLKIYSKLKLLGVSSQDSYEDSKRIVVSNQIMSLYFCCLVPYVPIFRIMNSKLLSSISVVLSLSILFCLVLNYRRKFLIARSAFILTISLPIYFFAAILGPETGIQFVTFMTMAISFIIFDAKQWLFKYLFIGLQICIFFSLEISNYAFFYKETFSSLNYMLFRYTVIFNVFLLILATLTYYSNLSSHFKNTLDNVNKMHNLTNRESEIINLLCKGKTNKEISDALYIEISTVKTHLNKIYRKQN